ncbi:GAF and ANTAR domain-containing protein [Agromyces sp. Marseille-P2726]|uniref:GAF and ANTAR domain-containing protein n=1 Tax=Agromyces sp. Marseille-P2726 TaxID=2709132 RepID=UPI00156DF756|nr:GAF and ANTAR domain-containing protein [Agromyces sp. Marseille-P2726]
MNDITRESRLLETFVTLADTLVDDYDVVDLLQLLVDTCKELLDVSEAAILLADTAGVLDVIASTSESSRLVELVQLSAEAGPCVESFRTGRPVSVPDVRDVPAEWSTFRDSAVRAGFGSVHAVPLRLRDTIIGSLNLLRRGSSGLAPEDAAASKAFADIATIGILHERSMRETTILAEQLQIALNSRIVVEQAKGVVAYTRGVSIDEAFELIRAYARSHRVGISQVAARLVDRSLDLPD